MRAFFIIGICLVAAYCVDRLFYDGTYSQPAVEMLRQIVVAYK